MAFSDTAVPTIVQIDASAHCQLECPSCPTANGSTLPAMGAGHLDPIVFEAFLTNNPEIREVELSNYGEMFLNPKLRDLLRTAFEHRVTLHADNGTNLNHAPDETLEALVLCRFRSLTVSIDGASGETYSQYRRKGEFERVINNIRKINEFKRKHRSGFPFLTWQFIVFGHNEHEIDAAREMAASLGMNFRPKISWDDNVSPIRDARLVQIKTGLPATREQHRNATGAEYGRSICYQLWQAPVLNWDGRILGCCRNYWGEFGGNAFQTGWSATLDASGIPAARQALMGRVPMDPALPCATCDLYLSMQRDGNWLTRAEIEKLVPKQIVVTSIVIDPADSSATHVDLFVTTGHTVNRLYFARPPAALRLDLATTFAASFVMDPGKYTIYALPKQLDPTFRRQYPPLPPVTLAIDVTDRPAAQEFNIHLKGGL